MAYVFRFTICTLIALALLCGSGLASDQKLPLIELAILAPFNYSYQGTILNITWFDGGSTTRVVRTFHDRSNRNRWEYLDPDGSPMIIVIADPEHQWEISPGDNEIYISTGIECCTIDEAPAELARLGHNYRVVQNGSATVVGRQTAIFTLFPHYTENPVSVLWVDTDTGLILRWEKYSVSGQILEMGVYTSFELVELFEPSLFTYHPSPLDKVTQVASAPLPEQVITLQKQVGQVIKYPTELPPGYRFSRGRVLSRFSPSDTVQLQFADGLNSISVFQTFHPDVSPLDCTTLSGQGTRLMMENTKAILVNTAEGYVLTWQKGNVTYSIVGDLPVNHLKAIAHSFRE